MAQLHAEPSGGRGNRPELQSMALSVFDQKMRSQENMLQRPHRDDGDSEQCEPRCRATTRSIQTKLASHCHVDCGATCSTGRFSLCRTTLVGE